MKWVFASSNPNKLREVSEVLEPLGIHVLRLCDLDVTAVEPVEDGETFEANATIKARSYAAQLGVRCIAEDSGLEVDFLDGAPGVHSARYCGVGGPRERLDQLNNDKLLHALVGVDSSLRTARYVCALCVADPDGSVVAQTQATFEGRIVEHPRGSGGFGYDPLFLVPDLGLTSAELSSEQKNARSHRGKALMQLRDFLAQYSSD